VPERSDEPAVTVDVADQRWTVTWSPAPRPPSGTNHGSSGVCLTTAGIVLVSQDGERWELPTYVAQR